MKNQEILERRTELKTLYKEINEEWKLYDEQYPVLPGAYKPPNYDQQQLNFLNRLRAASDQIGKLPKTTGEKMRIAIIWGAVIGAILIGIVLLVL